MKALYDYGYKVKWNDFYIDRKEGYHTSVTGFHSHEFYEIIFIFSGNTKILLSDRTKETNSGCIVLTKPGTPHFIACLPDTLYSRVYLVISPEFIADSVSEWNILSETFGKTGGIISFSNEQKDICKMILKRIESETNKLRQKLLILYLISYVNEFAQSKKPGLILYLITSLTLSHISMVIIQKKL